MVVGKTVDHITGFLMWDLVCDACEISFLKRTRGYGALKRKHHFCCNDCFVASDNGGKLTEYRRKIGRDRALHETDDVKQRRKRKYVETCIKKYGTDHPWRTVEVRSKSRITFLERYGVDHPWKSTKIRDDIRKTSLERYGFENPASSPEVKAKIDQVALHAKAHVTRKQNGSYAKSKIEDEFYQCLINIFGSDSVERQVFVNNWSIDFCVNGTVYVQFDGIHWHGLDRSLVEIERSEKSVDKVIFATHNRDVLQVEWFREQNKKLIRITDRLFKKLRSNESCQQLLHTLITE